MLFQSLISNHIPTDLVKNLVSPHLDYSLFVTCFPYASLTTCPPPTTSQWDFLRIQPCSGPPPAYMLSWLSVHVSPLNSWLSKRSGYRANSTEGRLKPSAFSPILTVHPFLGPLLLTTLLPSHEKLTTFLRISHVYFSSRLFFLLVSSELSTNSF